MTKEDYIKIRPNVYRNYIATLLCLWAYRQDQIEETGVGRKVSFEAFQQLVKQRYPQQYDPQGHPIPFEAYVQEYQSGLLNPNCKIQEAVCHLDTKFKLATHIYPDPKVTKPETPMKHVLIGM